MTREEYFEIKDDCRANGNVKSITKDDTKESLEKFFAGYKERYLLLRRMTGDGGCWILLLTRHIKNLERLLFLILKMASF